ncbi:Permease, partial [Snodgrassella alvi SCGC AB-598-O02]
NIHSPQVLLTIVGFCLIVTLEHYRIRGGIIIGILSVTAVASIIGLNQFQGVFAPVPSLAPTFLKLDYTI